jgi:hypothetical protein
VNSAIGLESYLSRQEYRGYDPYDALRSPLVRFFTLGNRSLRIAATQALRRLPWNIRPLLGISKDYNPKGLGLLLASYARLAKATGDQRHEAKAQAIVERLQTLASSGWSGRCWGYNFDWQSRAFFVPAGTPTMVNTCFVANGFLDTYDLAGDASRLQLARSCCDFVLRDLKRWDAEEFSAFSYTPIDDTRVHNANMLGAALLARVYSHTGEDILQETAARMVNYVMSCQLPHGGWRYAETSYQDWIDSFHTGFVLESLFNYRIHTGDKRFDVNLRRGLEFYKNEFFGADGTPYYYNGRRGPIDIHSPAQAVVTLCRLSPIDADCLPLAEKVLGWTIGNMQDPRGFFYFRKGRFLTNKIPYIRWGQAWMFHALTSYLALVGAGENLV